MNKINEKTKLLDENGNLLSPGYATEMLYEYDRRDIKANSTRIKEWDYYLIYNQNYAVALTIADNSYMGLISASVIDFKNKKEKTTSPMSFWPNGRTNFPSTSKTGDVCVKNKRSWFEFKNDNGNSVIWRDDIEVPVQIPDGSTHVDTAGTYYYEQPGTSHSYETTWMGPYIALDMDYDINQNNAVNARVELGLPGYESVGDQPYRFDWQHPKSVEDSTGMFGAFHFGAGANWTTALTDSVALSIGVTYDYYTVSGADAKTYLNMNYYDDLYNTRLAEYEKTYPDGGNYGGHDYTAEEIMLGIAAAENPDLSGVPKGDGTAMNVEYLREACPGGVCETQDEIESFYKSLGIRVGINARF